MAPAAISNAAESLSSNDAFQAGQSLGDAGFAKLANKVTADDADETDGYAQADIMGVVRVIGGAMIGIAVLVVVLNEIFSIESISNTSGPFGGVVDSLESTGVAALSLLVVGLLVAAANRVMGFFGGGGM